MSEPEGSLPPGEPEYLHLLLFECTQCRGPIVTFAVTEFRNPESSDATSFRLTCKCSWEGERMGATARRHYVERWNGKTH